MQKHFNTQQFWVAEFLRFILNKIPRVMKLSVFLLLCSIGLAQATDSYAQKATVNLEMRNQTVKEVLDEIEEQSDFSFFFNIKHVDLHRRVSVVAKKSDIFKVLETVFAGTDVRYSVVDKKIILSTEKQEAQQNNVKKRVTGIVKDKKGEPIIGANVSIKGTTTGTTTDLDGKFFLDVEEKDILLITYIGYVSQEIQVKNKLDIQVVLQEDTQVLEEVVVVGYGTMKKRDLTGAVASIRMADQPVNTSSSIAYMLSGKAAGLEINRTSAQPGAKSNMQIRGAGSVNAGNDPLIIIDGFPVSDPGNLGSGNRYSSGTRDNFLASLNPNDIESIEVLKDASSTAIYGARAGHGVIIVTTKRGENNAPVVKYSGSVSVQQISKGYDLLNASEYMTERNRNVYEWWLINNKIYPYGDNQIDDSVVTFTPKYTAEQIQNPVTDTDWFKEVTRSGFQTQHSISINGGNKNTKYLISGNYMKQDGILKGNDMSRYTGRINLDQKINNWLLVDFSINASRNVFHDVALGDGSAENASMLVSVLNYNPLIPIRDEKGNYSLNPESATVPNPVSMLDITDETVKDRFLGNVSISANPLEGLTFKLNAGIDRNHQKRKTYLPKTTLYGEKMNGQASISQSDRSDYLFELTATYSKQIQKNAFTILGGYSYQTFNNEWLTLGNNDFLTDGFLYNNMAAGNAEKPSVGSSAFIDKMASFFGRLNYSFKDRYLLTATLRADGSSNFAPDHRWGYFPSVSVGWRISEEPFWEKMKGVISNTKIRASYGQTGNANVGERAMSYYQVGYSTIWGDTEHKGVYLSQLGNPDLKWETTTEWNLGIDWGFMNNRLNVTTEFYSRVIPDLLNTRSLLSYNEVSSIMANIGSTQSKGFELTINSQNIQTKKFSWSTDLTFSFYRDKWKERADTWKPASYNEYIEPIRASFGYLSDGIIQPGETVDWMPNALPGQVKIKDIDGFLLDEAGNPVVDEYGRALKTGKPDGKLDDADKVMYGSTDPGYIFGLNNTLRYGRFDLNFYMYGQFNKLVGGDFYNSTTPGNFVYGSNYPINVKGAWAHDNTDGIIPGPAQSKNVYGAGDYFYYKTWFLRMRNITLGYTIPLKKIRSMRVYCDVNNPFIFTNYGGFDPETTQYSYAYPNVRSFSIGLDITF